MVECEHYLNLGLNLDIDLKTNTDMRLMSGQIRCIGCDGFGYLINGIKQNVEYICPNYEEKHDGN